MGIGRVVIDDNILIEGRTSTAGSDILYNFIPPFSSAVFDRLSGAGIAEIKQAKPNEFGISLTGGFGSVEAVASGEADTGIGCDINGSIRREAAEKGLCFIKPTYGTVSRYGLVSTAASMEQIGVVCGKIEDGFEALSIIAGFDERDGALAPTKSYSFSSGADDLKGIKIGVPGVCEVNMAGSAKRLTALGAEVEAFDFPLLDCVSGVAYVIATAETSNSISRFDGIKFGRRAENAATPEDIYFNTRSECFSFETKLFTLMGMFVLTKESFDVYFDKSLKLRRLIKDAVTGVLTKYDAVLMPAACGAAGKTGAFEDFRASYESLKYLALPNLTGNPAAAMPGGVQFMAKAFDENTLFRICKCFQRNMKQEGA